MDKKTINQGIEERMVRQGYLFVGRANGKASYLQGSNCRSVINADIGKHSERIFENYLISPGARRRYRSQGFINSIFYCEEKSNGLLEIHREEISKGTVENHVGAA